MSGMSAVTAVELEAERRQEVLLGDARRWRPAKDPTERRTRGFTRITASIAHAVVVRLATLRA